MKQLPNGWRRVELGELSERYLSGGTPATGKAALWDGEVAWTTSAPISAGDVRLDKAQRFISSLAISQSSTNLVPKGNLLVGTRVGVGKAVVNEIDIAISQDLTGLILSKAIEPSFAAFAFKLNEIQNFLDGRKRGTTIKGISRFDLASVPLNLPPLPQQRAIVATLSAIQSARNARIHELKLERERKAALMAHLFSHGTRGVAAVETPVGKFPRSWESVPICELGAVVTGGTPDTTKPEYYGDEFMFISPGDMNDTVFVKSTKKMLSANGLSVSRILPANSILVVCIGSTIGKVAITSSERSATNQQINAIVPSEFVSADFLYYAVSLKSRELPALAGKTAVPIINKSAFSQFKIPLPPLDEQREIAAILRACDDKIAALEDEATRLEELFRAMLEELMSGRISVATLLESQLTP